MKYRSMSVPFLTIGLDLGDRKSHLFALRHDGEICADEQISTTREILTKRLSDFESARVVIEAGGQSQWISELITDLGHEVIVASSNALGSKKTRRKNDRNDAELLARKGRSDPAELRPIQHRSSEAQVDLTLIRMRDDFVSVRTKLINCVRSQMKTHGGRLPSCSSRAFAKKATLLIPQRLRTALEPALQAIESISKQITSYEQEIERLAKTKYPETKRLTQVPSIGTLTALSYVLTLEFAKRFRRSRSVGAFVGLAPGLEHSGDMNPQLRISKAGDPYLRRLLVTAGQYTLGHFGPDSDLRRYGEAIAKRGGKNAKKRAVVAVARKLAVLLHKLWVTGDLYDPFYNEQKRAA